MIDLLKEFNKLPQVEQRAFLGFFAAPHDTITLYEGSDRFWFGKSECESVPLSFWLNKVVVLGWVTLEQGEKYPALGMADVPGENRKPWGQKITFTATKLGWDVREAFWASVAEGCKR